MVNIPLEQVFVRGFSLFSIIIDIACRLGILADRGVVIGCNSLRAVMSLQVRRRLHSNGGPRPYIFEPELPLSDIYFNHSNYRFELRFFFSF